MSDDELLAAIASSLGPTALSPRMRRGPSVSVTTGSQHDSIFGWSNILTPEISYRVGPRLTVGAATPIFLYLRSTETAASVNGAAPVSTTTVRHGVVGDTVLGAHFYAPPLSAGRRLLLYDVVSGLLLVPTGSVAAGVGTGGVTFNVTNHLEAASRWTPYVNVGFGTTGRIQSRRLQTDQTSRGYLANFAVGGGRRMPFGTRLSLEAFEQLPLGSQSVVQTEPRGERGGPGEESDILTSSSGLAEDNGFNSALDIPLNPRLVLSGLYSRSLRQHEDIAGFSFTFLLRTPVR